MSFKIVILSIISLSVCYNSTFAQKKDKKNKNAEPVKVIPKTNFIKDKIKSCKKIEGLFTMYQDTATGSVFMHIKSSQLNKEFIYFSYVENGISNTGHNRGTFRDNKIFKINKYFNQIEFITQNTAYYFDANHALAKSSDANISNAVMASEKIVAQNENGTEYLIEADNLFLTEALYQIKQGGPMLGFSGFGLGNLSKPKTHYHQIKNYPENSDVVVKYVFDNAATRGAPSQAVTDARYIEIYLQHSFIEMPKNNYKPRFDDPRIGYFTTQTNDMTTTNGINYRDLIHRWNLEKKDPSAALSEPVKPITWWIENTTPVEIRPIIKEAILQWNIAFEKAGFKNAIQINEQPDVCDWDAGDIRYNVLRWTSSPEPPFGGYGPSFVNPRTGEILGADIMLEWVFITNRLKSQKAFENQNLMGLTNDEEHHHNCSVDDMLHNQNLLGNALIPNNSESSQKQKDDLLKQGLYYLILHEVGHTLGLNHNMKASQLHSVEDLYNIKKIEEIGLIGSVMDYPAVNFSNRINQTTHYYTQKPGPYDLWAIEFGYFQETDSIKEQKRLNTILNRSTEPSLTFGNDADDMRSPGKAIDPRVMIGDLSSDAIGFAKERVDLIKRNLSTLHQNYGTDNRSYEALRSKFLILTGEWSVQAGVVSRYIGGVYVDRSFTNQKSTKKPFEPVSVDVQKNAMKWLNDYLFAPQSVEFNAEMISLLQQQRRGFGFFSSGEDPKIHDRILNMQKSVLMHLLHPTTLKRISDSKLYGNTYSLSDVLKDLSQSIFQADMLGSVNSSRQNLQILYVNMLIDICDSRNNYDLLSQSKASSQISNIQKMLQTANTTSTGETKEHRNYLLLLIKNHLNASQAK